MGRRSSWMVRAVRLATGMLAGLALVAGAAHAKPWAKLAPAPLASDSAYAALSARPADSLGTDEFSWVDVQRDWRSQRAGEETGGGRGISASGTEHVSRAGDARFARLASRAYGTLTDSERAWLVTENAAQRAQRSGGGAAGTVGIVLVAAALGALLAVWIIGDALGSGLDNLFGK